MACDASRPVGIRPAELALAICGVHEQIRPAGWKQTLFGGLIAHTQGMELAALPLRLYQTLGLCRLAYARRLTRLLPRPLRGMEAMLPHPPQRPLRHALSIVTETRATAQRGVGFFSLATGS